MFLSIPPDENIRKSQDILQFFHLIVLEIAQNENSNQSRSSVSSPLIAKKCTGDEVEF